jgi:general secretion pathway protein K
VDAAIPSDAVVSGSQKAAQRGGALLTVLWLSAALSAIAFTVANTVRSETERTSTAVDSVRAYYLAAGAIDRALLYMSWGASHRNPDGSPRYYAPGMRLLRLPFPTGEASVEIIPESSKMNVNFFKNEEMERLITAIGADPERARQIALAIADWKSPAPPGQPGPFDGFYLSRVPSFLPRHASIEEIEEILLVHGMTPELFHGTYVRDPQGRLVFRGGLKHCLSVWGSVSGYDANTAEPPVLAAIGMSPEAIAALIALRNASPLGVDAKTAMEIAGPAAGRLRIGGVRTYTLRATATLRLPDGRLSDIRRSVAATIRYEQHGYDTLRWYDTARTE